MTFRYGLEPVLIQWILIGLKAILKILFYVYCHNFQNIILFKS